MLPSFTGQSVFIGRTGGGAGQARSLPCGDLQVSSREIDHRINNSHSPLRLPTSRGSTLVDLSTARLLVQCNEQSNVDKSSPDGREPAQVL